MKYGFNQPFVNPYNAGADQPVYAGAPNIPAQEPVNSAPQTPYGFAQNVQPQQPQPLYAGEPNKPKGCVTPQELYAGAPNAQVEEAAEEEDV